MNKKKEELVDSIFKKLKSYETKGINITKKDVEAFFSFLINKK